MSKKLAPLSPFRDLTSFEPFRNLESFFNDFRFRPALQNFDAEPAIRMDVSESDDAYTVKAEIPGVKKEDIKVSIDGHQVCVSAEVRREEEEKKGEKVVRSERYYGQQMRSFTLGHEIDEAKSVARYKNGVLELTLPKKSNGAGVKTLRVE